MTHTEYAYTLLAADRAAHDLEDAERRKQPVPAMPELTADQLAGADDMADFLFAVRAEVKTDLRAQGWSDSAVSELADIYVGATA